MNCKSRESVRTHSFEKVFRCLLWHSTACAQLVFPCTLIEGVKISCLCMTLQLCAANHDCRVGGNLGGPIACTGWQTSTVEVMIKICGGEDMLSSLLRTDAERVSKWLIACQLATAYSVWKSQEEDFTLLNSGKCVQATSKSARKLQRFPITWHKHSASDLWSNTIQFPKESETLNHICRLNCLWNYLKSGLFLVMQSKLRRELEVNQQRYKCWCILHWSTSVISWAFSLQLSMWLNSGLKLNTPISPVIDPALMTGRNTPILDWHDLFGSPPGQHLLLDTSVAG